MSNLWMQRAYTQKSSGVPLALLRGMDLQLRLVAASDGVGDAGAIEVLEGKQEFLAELLERLNEIIRKPDGRYTVVYDPETRKPRRIQRI